MREALLLLPVADGGRLKYGGVHRAGLEVLVVCNVLVEMRAAKHVVSVHVQPHRRAVLGHVELVHRDLGAVAAQHMHTILTSGFVGVFGSSDVPERL